MQFSLSIFLFVYFVFLFIFCVFTFFNLYHIYRYGFIGFWPYFITILYVFFTVAAVYLSFYFLLQIDWSYQITIFENINLNLPIEF